jgi:hypothetical protein
MPTFSPLQEAREFREQLSSGRRRTGFLFGAGTSQAVGLDGIAQLTTNVGNELSGEMQKLYEHLLTEVGPTGHVEHVLNTVRLYRELLGDTEKEARGITGMAAAALDRSICKGILTRVSISPSKGYQPHLDFATWVRSIDRVKPVEIFTLNYDLLIEQALEQTLTPHFDGFIGSVEPHFVAASVDGESDFDGPPASWVRVWKLHGSIGWRLSGEGKNSRIIRVPQKQTSDSEDLLIYPSREKYNSSRRQPYVTYQDRLRRFLLSGEALLVVAGYSFGDQHINEIIFEGLRTNNRLSVTALLYGDLNNEIEKNLLIPCDGYRNLTVYCGDQPTIAGVTGSWSDPGSPPPLYDQWPFWNEATEKFTLGDFSSFAEYLRVFLGASERGRSAIDLGSATLPVKGTIGDSVTIQVNASIAGNPSTEQ